MARSLGTGCTRLELGLQSIYEDVARDTNRGHTIESAKGCFQLAKDAGFKVIRRQAQGRPYAQRLGCCLCALSFSVLIPR